MTTMTAGPMPGSMPGSMPGMLTGPAPASPGVGSVLDGAGSDHSGVPVDAVDSFAAVMARMLGATVATASARPPVDQQPDGSNASESQVDEAGSADLVTTAPQTLADVVAGLGLAALVATPPPSTPATLTGSGPIEPATAPSTVDPAAVASVTAAVAADESLDSTAPVAAKAPDSGATAIAAPATTTTASIAKDRPATTIATPLGQQPPAPRDAAAPAPYGHAAPAVEAAPQPVTSPTATTDQAQPTTAVAQVSATSATTAPGTGPAPTDRVSVQVIPEITRLVTTGDGVHRLTLHLNPRALGDVRVVLTLRDGVANVRIAAGDAARVELLRSSPELQRMLEQAGVHTARVDVRDLAGAASGTTNAAAPSPAGEAGSSGTTAFELGEQRNQNQHHPGMGGGHFARDGADTTTGTARSRPGQPFNRAPATGVDLTM